MAFLDSVIGDRMPTARTYLEAIQRVIRACGQDAPTSITGELPNHVTRAKAAVDDALQRVYNACLWDFRGRWAYLKLENNTMWYRLPADFAARKSEGLVLKDTTESALGDVNNWGPIRFIEYNRFMGYYPDLVTPDATSAGEPNLGYRTRLIAVLADHVGVPLNYTIFGDFLGVYPIPNESLEDESRNSFQMDIPVLFAYWGLQKDLSANDDAIPLPHNLLLPFHFIALGYYKQAMEYADFQADEGRGEGLLSVEVAKYMQKSGDQQLNLVSEGYDGGV